MTVAVAPVSAMSVSTASSAIDPSISGLLEVQDASVHLIATKFVEGASLINRSIPPMLFQYLPCFCFNCVFALTVSTSSRIECQAYQTYITWSHVAFMLIQSNLIDRLRQSLFWFSNVMFILLSE